MDFENSVVFVNGFQETKDYVLKENDICTVRCYPSATGVAIGLFALAWSGIIVNSVDEIYAGLKGKHFLSWKNKETNQDNSYDQLQQVPTVKGQKNKNALNTPCPLVLGKSLYTPSYVGSPYTTISGEDGENITYHALFRLGYNDINVRNICLGMTDLASNAENKRNGFLTIDGQFSESEYGTKVELQQDGAEVSLYPQKVYQENLNIDLINADGTALTTNRFSAMHPQTVEIEFTINGLIGYNDEGEKENRSISISIEESLDGGNTWRSFGQITGSNSYSGSTSKITRKKAKVMRFVAKKTYSYADAFNATNKTVEYRIKRTSKVATDNRTSDIVYLTAIRTWCYDNEKSKEAGELIAQTPVIEKDRNKMARLGFEIKGGDAIQGTIEELNCVLSSNARTWNGTKWSDTTSETNNPASLALLAMQGKHRGNEIVKDSKIDLEQYGEFYEWCEEKDFACNGVLSKQQKTQDVVKNILSCGRAFWVLSGNKFGCLIDNDKRNVVMILNNQNVLEASNNKDFDILPDGYRVKFYNENNYYQQDEMIVCYDGVDVNNPDLVLESIELPYQTNPSQVYRYARYSLACRKNRPEVWNRKVSIDGNLIEIGSLVEVQDDTILVGTGEGAEIKDVIVENDSVVSIVTDGQFEVVDINKEYGLAITCANGIDEPRVIKRKVNIVRDGIHNVFVFSEPLSLDNICPSIGDLVSFGEYEKITTEAICFGKKDNGDGTFELTLIPYNAAVYNADIGEIPEFESKVTIPSKLPTEEIKLEPATKDDVNTQINGVLGGTLQVAPDSALSVKSAYVYQDYIEIILSFSQNGSKNQVDKVFYRIDNGESTNTFEANELTYRYYFDREKEGYKEADDFSMWKVSAKIKNVFGLETDWCENVFVDVTKYGTWQIGKPNVSAQVLDRSAFLTLSLPSRSDNKPVYGNIRYKIVIQRIGNKDIEGTEDYVEADTDWYKPATFSSWQASEDNYRQGSAVTSYDDWLTCNSSYSQTLPLVGQTNKNSVATEYRYKVVAYNEAGYSAESDIISVTALPTNLTDIVHSNENYKDLYVQRLSAISANIGLISQGGFGSFERSENYWALSNLSEAETGVQGGVKKGAFRVGGIDQYILVEPVIKNGVEDYSVSVKAGNLKFESDKTDVDGSLIAYDNNDPTKETRLRLTSKGVEFQKAISFDSNGVADVYKSCGFVRQSPSGSMIVTNTDVNDDSLPQEKIMVPSDVAVYHFDIDEYDTNKGNAGALSLEGTIVGSESPLSSAVFNGRLSANVQGKSCAFFTKSNAIETDKFLLKRDGSTMVLADIAASLGIDANILSFK